MLNENQATAIEIIKKALHDRSDKKISGALLGELILRVAPPDFRVRDVMGIRVGAGALVKFIQNYLPDTLRQIGLKGNDILYEIYEPYTESLNSSTFVTPNHLEFKDVYTPEIWNIFVRSNSSNIVAYDVNLKQLRICNRSDDFENNSTIKIASITVEEFNDIREEFMRTMHESAKKYLQHILNDESIYTEWVEKLRHSHELEYKRWMEFRREKIKYIFSLRLEKLNLLKEQHSILMDFLIKSQKIQNQNNIKNNTAKKNIISNAYSINNEKNVTLNELFLRNAIIEVVAKMDITALRELNLPVGLVIDAVRKG